MAKKVMDPAPKKGKMLKQEYRVDKLTGTKTPVMPTSVQKAKAPSTGSGNPFTGTSKSRGSAFSNAAQKRMKADAEGTYKSIATKTRVLPELMSGKVTVKASLKKPSIKKK